MTDLCQPSPEGVFICNTQLVPVSHKPWRDRTWSPANAAAFTRSWFADPVQERYAALAILPDGTFNLATNLSYGSGNITLLRVQEVLRTFGHLQDPAMAEKVMAVMDVFISSPAHRLVLIHIHPDGQRQPSRHDKIFTGIIQAAAIFMGIDLVDHLILVGLFEQAGYLSMREQGYMDDPVNLMGILRGHLEDKYPVPHPRLTATPR